MTGMSDNWVAFLCLSFIIWSKISLCSTMLTLKYLFGKAWLIAAILGYLWYLTIGSKVGWDISSKVDQ